MDIKETADSNKLEQQGSKKKIVLIDDETGVVLALKLLLQLYGFEVETFSDPELGIAHISNNAANPDQHSIDYILCDLRMPKKTGLDVLIATRRLAVKIPFFLMSGHASDEEQEQALELGAAGFLSKPFSPEDFLKLLGR